MLKLFNRFVYSVSKYILKNSRTYITLFMLFLEFFYPFYSYSQTKAYIINDDSLNHPVNTLFSDNKFNIHGEQSETITQGIHLKLLDTKRPPDFLLIEKDEDLTFNMEDRLTYLTEKPDEINLFGKYSPLAEDTAIITLLVIGSIAILYAAPKSVSKWEDEDKDLSLESLKERWKDNVTDGPVWDDDEDWINYIGHPYFGAGYYVHSYHLGYNRLESFLYAVFMSTFLYEYGFEAFFEIPSTQDLIFTPIGGALLGELFLLAEKNIVGNGSRVLGSEMLGTFCLGVIDPLGVAVRAIKRLNGKWLRINVDVEYYMEHYMDRHEDPYKWMDYDDRVDFRVGFLAHFYRK